MPVNRIQRWEEYRKLALEVPPKIIYYAIDSHPLRNPPWGLKLIFYQGFNGYVFYDYTEGATLHKTKIPIQGKDKREVPLLITDIEHFIHAQIGKITISPIHSFWSYHPQPPFFIEIDRNSNLPEEMRPRGRKCLSYFL